MLEALQIDIQENLHELIKNIFDHTLFHFLGYFLEDDINPEECLGSSFNNFVAYLCKFILMGVLFIGKFLVEGMKSLLVFKISFLSVKRNDHRLAIELHLVLHTR